MRHVSYAFPQAVIKSQHNFHQTNPGVSWLCAPECQHMFRTLSHKESPTD